MERTVVDVPSVAVDPALALPHRRKMEILIAILLALFLLGPRPDDRRCRPPDDRGRPRRQQRAVHVGRHDLPARPPPSPASSTASCRTSTGAGRCCSSASRSSSSAPRCRASRWSMESLILFRGIQGVGAGAIFPVSLAVIGDLFTSPRARPLHGPVRRRVRRRRDPRPVAGRLADRQRRAGIGSSTSTCPSGLVVLYIIYRYLPSIHGERPDAQARLPRRRRCSRSRSRSCSSA